MIKKISNTAVRLDADDLSSGSSRRLVERFLSSQGAYHFTQHPDWAVANGVGDYIGVATVVDNELIGWTLLRKRKVPLFRVLKYFAERGPVVGELRAVKQHVMDVFSVLESGAIYLTLHPYCFGEFGQKLVDELSVSGFSPEAGSEKHYDQTLLIDLEQDVQGIRSKFRRSVKTQINKATRLGVTISELTSSEEINKFSENYFLSMKQKGIETPINMEKLLQFYSVRPKGFALQAYWQGQPVAGIALVGCGRNLVYQWGYSSQKPEHRGLPLQHGLHWHAIQLAKAAGYIYYDMGGFWRERGDQDPINRFKLGFTDAKVDCGEALAVRWHPLLSKFLTP